MENGNLHLSINQSISEREMFKSLKMKLKNYFYQKHRLVERSSNKLDKATRNKKNKAYRIKRKLLNDATTPNRQRRGLDDWITKFRFILFCFIYNRSKQ